MSSISPLLSKLTADFPSISFKTGDDCHWSSSLRTIFYTPDCDEAELLHELAHALLGHSSYNRDIELLMIEREAWEYAKVHLAPTYEQRILDNMIETALDTYRDWLHARSTCPNCDTTGIQTRSHEYTCPVCHSCWKVNEARTCALRRTKVTQK